MAKLVPLYIILLKVTVSKNPFTMLSEDLIQYLFYEGHFSFELRYKQKKSKVEDKDKLFLGLKIDYKIFILSFNKS